MVLCGWCECLPRASSRRRRSFGQLWLGGLSDSIVGTITAATRQQDILVLPTVVPADPPSYRRVAPWPCSPLHQACWLQEWSEVVRRLTSHPQEAFCLTHLFRETALHECFDRREECPVVVLEELLRVNPHAVVVHEKR